MPKQTIKSDMENSSESRSLERFWAKRGEEDVAYQRQAQVTWWTLLGGIAAAVLLTQIDPLFTAVRSGHWYYGFYFLATCLVIINAWVQTSWGALVLRWPITVPGSITIFFGGMFLSICALFVTRPGLWFGAVTITILSSQLMQYSFKKQKGWIALPKEAIKRVTIGLFIYWLFALFAAVSCVILLVFPTVLFEIVWGILALLLSLLALYWQHKGMQEEKKRMGIA